MIQQKDNDMLLNVMENPSFSIADFQNVGLSVDNTSLQPKDVYQNSPQIQSSSLFQDNTGNFDPTKFNKVYNTAAGVYNMMANNTPQDQSDFKVQYSKYDIFAPETQINTAPDFNINTHTVNPDRTTSSTVKIGMEGPRTKTAAEIAQSQKVWNPTTQQWEDSPEDSLFGNFGHVRALAQYEADTDINGIQRGETGFDDKNIAHHEGELKINPETGTYYYEDIDGKNINGRQILHFSDVLTNEDSPINSIDIFDSDDIHKTPIGSFMKNAFLVGSMFIPYVGPVITGATILQQAASFGATLGKIATSSDNKAFNFIQGIAEASDPFRTRSEYSQQNMWTLENIFGMMGDTVAQLKQQRVLFQQLPRILGKDARVLTQEGQEAMKAEYAANLNKNNMAAIQDKFKVPVNQLVKENPVALANATEQLQLQNSLKAADQLENYMKDYYNIGGVLSKAYMTLLTVNDMYDTAKKAGASDTLAGLTTLGYAAAEYALLSTGLGEWILPELRAGRMTNRAAINAFSNDMVKSFEIESGKATTKAAKETLWSKAINYGKKIFNADYAVGRQSTLGKTISSTVAASLGEGTEEVSEDVLQDFVNVMYNLYNSATGSDSRMHNENWQDQYFMDFLGGFMGGGIANATLNFNAARQTTNMTQQQAAQHFVYMARNEEQLNDFNKLLDKTTLGNKNLSATKTIKDENGNIIGWEQGTDDDNQDKFIKDTIKQNINLIKNTLEATGGNIDDQSLFSANTLKDLRYQYLYNSTTTARLIQNFNDLNVRAVKLNNDIINLSQQTADQKNKENSPEYATIQESIKKKQQELKEVTQQIEDLRSGKKAALYMAPALLETSPYVLQGFLKSSTFEGYAETKEGKAYKDISTERLDKLKQEYQDYVHLDKKYDIDIATQEYLKATKLFANNFKEIQDSYKKLSESVSTLEDLNTTINAIDYINESPDEDTWLTKAQEISDKLSESLPQDSPIIQEINALNNAVTEYLNTNTVTKSIEEVVANGVQPGDAISQEARLRRINKITKENLVQGIVDQVNNLKNIGGAPATVKKVLSQHIDRLINTIGQEDYGPKYQGESRDTMKDYAETLYQLFQAQSDLNTLPYTPIMKIADSYINAVYGGNNFKVSDIFTKLSSLENQSASDLSQFMLTEDLNNQITRADRVLAQIESITEGARSDDATLIKFNVQNNTVTTKDNIWGINATLNDVAKRSGDKEWEELPTIEGATADALFVDIHSLRQKLQYYKTLYGINKGQKLNNQTRIATHNAYLMYNKIKTLADVVPSDWDKSDLEKVLPTLTFLENNYKDDKLNLNIADQVTLRTEQINMEDAVYDFFQKNSDKDLSQLFNEETFKVLTDKQTLLNETTSDVDNSSFIGWLAAKAAIKSSTFYENIISLLNNNSIVPLDSQLEAIQLGLGNIINGPLITKFAQAARKAAIHYVENLDIKQSYDYFKNTLHLHDQAAALYSTKEGKQLFRSLNYYNRYDNITFIEGIAGAGKSTAVDSMIVKYIQNYFGDKGILDNAWVVNTNTNTANSFRQSIGIDPNEKLSFDRTSLLEKISNWTEPSNKDIDDNGYLTSEAARNRLTLNKSGLTSKFKINDNVSDIPKVIFIDELGRFTSDEVDLINEFAKKNNISVITSGDLSQTQSSYKVGYKDIFSGLQQASIKRQLVNAGITFTGNSQLLTGISTNSFLHTPKIGTSMRTLNSQQDANQQTFIANMQEYSNDPSKGVNINFHYWENERELHGTKLVNSEDTTIVTQTLDKMLASLSKGEKIGYVYSDTNSPLYKVLTSTPKYWDHIQPYKGNSAQGLEGKYWIIEPSTNNISDIALLQDIYTGITRAYTGSILVLPNNGTFTSRSSKISIQSSKDNNTQILKFSDIDKKRYTDRVIEVFNEALDGIVNEPTEYVERSSAPEDTSTQVPDNVTNGSTVDTGSENTDTSKEGTTDTDHTQTFEEWKDQTLKEANKAIRLADAEELADAQKRLSDYQNLLNSTTEADKQRVLQGVVDQLQNIVNNKQRKLAVDSATSGIDFDSLTNYTIDTDGTIIIPVNKTVPGIWVAKLYSNYHNTFNDATLVNIKYNPSNGKVTLEWSDSSDNFTVSSINDTELFNFLNTLDPNPTTEQTLLTEDQQKDDISNSEDQDNNNKESDPEVIDDTFLLDSTKTFETGWEGDIDNLQPGPWANSRIDGLNGYLTIDDNGNVISKLPTNTWDSNPIKGAILSMAYLRKLAFNINDKSTLEKLVGRNLGLGDAYITFAIKCVQLDNESGSKYNFNRLNKSSNEQILFSDNSNRDPDANIVEDNDSDYKDPPIKRNLVMIIGDRSNKQDVLEIPLLKINSPITKIIQLGLEDNLKAARSRNENLRDTLEDLRINDPEVKAHPSLCNLIFLYTHTNNHRAVFYQKDYNWTLAKNLQNTGPRYNSGRGKITYIENTDLVQKQKFATLDEMSRPDVYISSVMSCLNGGYVSYNGKRIQAISSPGHVFVLYTTDPFLEGKDSEMIEQYIKQQAGDTKERTVGIKYLTTPEITLDQYVQSIIQFITTENLAKSDSKKLQNTQRIDILGNDKTSYLILSSILFDENSNLIEEHKNTIQDLLSNSWGKDDAVRITNFLVDTLQDLNSLDQKTLMKRLTTKVDWSNSSDLPIMFGMKDRSLSQQLMTVIRQLVDPITIDSDGNINIKGSHNSDVIAANTEVLNQMFTKSGKKIYFQARLEKVENADLGYGFKKIKVDRNNPHQVAYDGSVNIDKDFKIFGLLGSNMYITDESDPEHGFNAWIADIVNNRLQPNGYSQNPWNQIKSTDNRQYINGQSCQDTVTPNNSFNKEVSDLINKYKFIKDLNLQPNGINTTLTSEQKQQVYQAFINNGYIVIGNIIKPITIFNPKDIASYTEPNGQEIPDITIYSPTSNEFTLKVNLNNGDTYTAEINMATNSINFIKDQKVPSQQQKHSIIDITEDSKEAYKSFLNDYIGNNVAQAKIIIRYINNNNLKDANLRIKNPKVIDLFYNILSKNLQNQNLTDKTPINEIIAGIIDNRSDQTRSCSIGISF